MRCVTEYQGLGLDLSGNVITLGVHLSFRRAPPSHEFVAKLLCNSQREMLVSLRDKTNSFGGESVAASETQEAHRHMTNSIFGGFIPEKRQFTAILKKDDTVQ